VQEREERGKSIGNTVDRASISVILFRTSITGSIHGCCWCTMRNSANSSARDSALGHVPHENTLAKSRWFVPEILGQVYSEYGSRVEVVVMDDPIIMGVSPTLSRMPPDHLPHDSSPRERRSPNRARSQSFPFLSDATDSRIGQNLVRHSPVIDAPSSNADCDHAL